MTPEHAHDSLASSLVKRRMESQIKTTPARRSERRDEGLRQTRLTSRVDAKEQASPMSSIESNPDSPDTHGQICPVCQLPPTSVVERTVRGIVLIDFMCPFEHLWMVKFPAVAA